MQELGSVNRQEVYQVEIFDNPNLATCESFGLCNYLENGGSATIYNNASGCNSKDEVLDACQLVPVEEASYYDQIVKVSPNPTQGRVFIEGLPTTDAKLRIVTITGKVLQDRLKMEQNWIDLSTLKNGIYFLTIHIDDQVVVKRIVKQ